MFHFTFIHLADALFYPKVLTIAIYVRVTPKACVLSTAPSPPLKKYTIWVN